MSEIDANVPASVLAERREALVNALESDEFPQDKKRLRTKRGYCCLGVACEVFRRLTGEGEWIPSSEGFFYFKTDDSGAQSTVLPYVVEQFFGLHGENPVLFWDDGEQSSAASANDSLDFDFQRIAVGFKTVFAMEANDAN